MDTSRISEFQKNFRIRVKIRNGNGLGMEAELLGKYLIETGGDTDYFNAIETNQIQFSRLLDIEKRIQNEGTFLVTSYYGTLANAVAGEPVAAPDVIDEAVKIIHKGLIKLKEEISVNGNEVEKFTPQEMNTLRRALAVMVFLAHRALCGMEAKCVQHALGSGEAIKKKGKSTETGNIDKINWRNLRSMIIEDLLAILELPVERIWDDSGYGYSVPRLLIRTMCSNFNEPALAKENLKAGNDAYKILAILAKRFGRPSDVYGRLFPIIKYGEDVAKLVSGTVEIMTHEFGIEDAVWQALKTAIELTETIGGKNTAPMEKGIATLLIELSSSTPKEVLEKCGPFLVQFLEVESAPIRSAAIQCATQLMRWLRIPHADAVANRKLREMILDEILLLHCKDSNSLVRAKALQNLAKLIDEKILDPVEVASCFKTAIARITDSAVYARKYALAIVNVVLSTFPGICNQSINYRDEIVNHRKNLLQILARKSPRKCVHVLAIVREFAQQVQIQEVPLPEAYESAIEEGMQKVRPLIAELVQNENYWDASTVLFHAFQRYGKDVGIKNAGKIAAIPKMYISYFNTLSDVGNSGSQSQKSMLNASLDMSMSLSQETEENDWFENEEVTAARDVLQFSQGSLKMKLQLEQLVDKMTVLLQLGSSSDRTEVITTFGELVRCGYPISDRVTGPIIQAIASLGKDSAGDLVPAFWSIFIGDKDVGHVQMIKNIFKTLVSVNSATKDLLKPIIGEMYTGGHFPRPAIMILWDAFTQQYEGTWNASDSKNAVFILGAIAKNDQNVILSNIKLLIETGLSKESLNDMEFVRSALEAILYSLKVNKKGESDVSSTHRFKPDHPLFGKLLEVLIHGVSVKGNWDTHQHFPRVAELAIQIIYKLSWDHSACTSALLHDVPAIVFGGKDRPLDAPDSEIKDSEEIYIRYLAIMTALLGTHINYCETVVIPEIKRRKIHGNGDTNASVFSKTNRSIQATPSSRNSMITSVTSTSTISKRGGKKSRAGKPRQSSASTTSSAMSEMEAIIGTTGFDVELDVIKTYVEKLLDHGTFQQFRRLTLFFCQKITTIQHVKLQIVIVQAMAKLMLVSAESVNKLVEAFINLWKMIENVQVKVEVLKHLTHLNVRFPNQVEQCNVIIKSGLLSDNEQIKTACLDFMGFLALGDIVKIRNNIAEVALCLASEKQIIRELSRDFFDVCAEKDNIISNAVPEVISQLSSRTELSQEKFQDIMKFLLMRVKKEKQIVGLVETLITRLKSPTGNERLWEDTSFCLTHLAHNEKSFKIIQNNINNFSDKLKNDVVYTSFKCIVEKMVKETSKPDFKAKLEDFDRELDGFRENCIENSRIADVRERHKAKKSRVSEKSSGEEESSLMEDTSKTQDDKEDTSKTQDDTEEMSEEDK